MADDQERHERGSEQAHRAIWKELERLRNEQREHEKVDTNHHNLFIVLEGDVKTIQTHIAEFRKSVQWGIATMIAIMTLAVFLIQVAVEVWHSFRGH